MTWRGQTNRQEHLELLLRTHGWLSLPLDEREVRVELSVEHYANGNIAILALMAGDQPTEPWATVGERYGILTVNEPSVRLADDEILVKTWSENEDWYLKALQAYDGVFEYTGRRHKLGFAFAEVWRIIPYGKWREDDYGNEEEEPATNEGGEGGERGAGPQASDAEGAEEEGERREGYPDYEAAFRFEA